MKRLLFLLFLIKAIPLFAQVDTVMLVRVYDRAMRLDEGRVDSIEYYADYINRIYLKGQYPKGKVLALRLYGYYYENKAEYEKAIDYYLQTLDESRRLNDIPHEINALTDLAIVYTQDMKQPQKAKDVYLQCVTLNKQRGEPVPLTYSYINLGAIYNRLGLHDSALLILQEGLRIGKPLEKKGAINLQNLYNNLGVTYYHLKQYDKALLYFRNNYGNHLNDPSAKADLWYDVLNLGDSYTEKAAEEKGVPAKASFDSAEKYADQALLLAGQLASKSKESDSYQILSKFYQRKGDFKRAFDYQRRWYELDTALVNGETYSSIAELEAKYEARKRENEKLLLQGEVAQQKFNGRIMMITAISLLLVAIAAALAFMTKQRINKKLQATNDLFIRQNDRLSELNYEKNSLISIVSHDLSTPFASIGMWNQLLQSDMDNLTAEQQKGLIRIGQATQYGEKLIRHILDVEKAQTNLHKMNLENLDLQALVGSVLENFHPAADKKGIHLHLGAAPGPLYFLSDRQLLSRMLENLLSNAIKYTASGGNVWVDLSQNQDAIRIKVKDEGVGIEQDELPHLFSKYSKISSQPTNGEPSTGLGLAIVKRIVEELNGEIDCDSVVGEGSVFTVLLKK